MSTPGPSWRARLAPRLMALVRLAAGWLVAAGPLALLAAAGSPLRASLATPARLATAAALAVGMLAFAWPRTYAWGLGLLVAGLAGFEALWRGLGLAPNHRLASSIAIVAVLATGEWLRRRVARRL